MSDLPKTPAPALRRPSGSWRSASNTNNNITPNLSSLSHKSSMSNLNQVENKSSGLGRIKSRMSNSLSRTSSSIPKRTRFVPITSGAEQPDATYNASSLPSDKSVTPCTSYQPVRKMSSHSLRAEPGTPIDIWEEEATMSAEMQKEMEKANFNLSKEKSDRSLMDRFLGRNKQDKSQYQTPLTSHTERSQENLYSRYDIHPSLDFSTSEPRRAGKSLDDRYTVSERPRKSLDYLDPNSRSNRQSFETKNAFAGYDYSRPSVCFSDTTPIHSRKPLDSMPARSEASRYSVELNDTDRRGRRSFDNTNTPSIRSRNPSEVSRSRSRSRQSFDYVAKWDERHRSRSRGASEVDRYHSPEDSEMEYIEPDITNSAKGVLDRIRANRENDPKSSSPDAWATKKPVLKLPTTTASLASLHASPPPEQKSATPELQSAEASQVEGPKGPNTASAVQLTPNTEAQSQLPVSSTPSKHSTDSESPKSAITEPSDTVIDMTSPSPPAESKASTTPSETKPSPSFSESKLSFAPIKTVYSQEPTFTTDSASPLENISPLELSPVQTVAVDQDLKTDAQSLSISKEPSPGTEASTTSSKKIVYHVPSRRPKISLMRAKKIVSPVQNTIINQAPSTQSSLSLMPVKEIFSQAPNPDTSATSPNASTVEILAPQPAKSNSGTGIAIVTTVLFIMFLAALSPVLIFTTEHVGEKVRDELVVKMAEGIRYGAFVSIALLLCMGRMLHGPSAIAFLVGKLYGAITRGVGSAFRRGIGG